MLVASSYPLPGLYLPPVFKVPESTITAPDDHFTANPHCRVRRLGKRARCQPVDTQLFVPGLYLPPVFRSLPLVTAPDDHFTTSPHCRVSVSRVGCVSGATSCPTIRRRTVSTHQCLVAKVSSAPDDHLTAGPDCVVIGSAAGALVVLVAVQLFVFGLYLPPVLKLPKPSPPPQTIISLPVQTAVWLRSRLGALTVLVAVQLFAAGLYLAASVKRGTGPFHPPQTIISLPFHTAVCNSSCMRAHSSYWSLSNYRCWDCISRQCSNRRRTHRIHPRLSFPACPDRRVRQVG